MITPTDRSMPAVRMTSVCAMPRMPMIVTWVSTVDRLLPVTKCEKLTVMPSRRPKNQHDEGNGGRIEMQEALDALGEREALLLERSLRRRGRRQDLFELLRCRPPALRRFAHGFLVRFPNWRFL